jgi:1-acyl-sn-glycerol-3-phosphate acyltransferase
LIRLRSFLFAAYVYVWSAILAITVLPLLLAPRGAMMAVFRLWSRSITWGLRVICGVRLDVRGRENVPTGAALIAPKHQCMYDTIVPFHLLPDGCLVMKKELTRIPFYGWYAMKTGMVIVDRAGAAKTLRKMMAEARQRMAAGRQLLIFPEGHRMAPGEAPDYKPGVAGLYRELNVPCVPVATNSGVHWPAHGFTRWPGTIVVEYLPAIPPGLKRAEFMRELQSRIETATNALLAEGL